MENIMHQGQSKLNDYVIQWPDSRLAEPAKPVNDKTLGVQIADEMLRVTTEIRTKIYEYPRGFEIAAPQIGIPYRVVLLQGDFQLNPVETETIILVNPEILWEYESHDNWEDCLSVDGMRGCVRRCGKINIRYQDLNGIIYEQKFYGTSAADIQHGVDHLDGKLYFERDMKYFIPLQVYRPLMDQGVNILDEFVRSHYRPFDPNQQFSTEQMHKLGLSHSRECLPITGKLSFEPTTN